ncbi:MAG: hypothetical protein R3E83_12645 [Burkholderiaceae bacterium]
MSTLPYPDNSEYAAENPLWRRTPFTQVRHRMDLLYGKAFSLANLSPELLADIDDFFGPLSTETIAQSIGFARHQRICDQHGQPYEFDAHLAACWQAPTFWVHGEQNGIFEASSVALAHALFDRCGIGQRLSSQIFPGLGHQDSLIGRDCGKVLQAIGRFLGEP